MLRQLIAASVAGLAALIVVPAPASAATTKPLLLRQGLTLTIPQSWKVYRVAKDWTRVVTGSCPTKGTATFGFRDSGCRSFWIMGPAAIKVGHEHFEAYDPDGPFYPASDVGLCVYDKNLYIGGITPAEKGLRRLGSGHRAYYRDWKVACVKTGRSRSTVKGYFHQREWFLPTSKILIIDQWRTPGLSTILKRAVWR